MKHKIPIGKNDFVTLIHDNIDSSINVDSLTLIDTSNIFGEAVTISTAANRIGLLKAEVEKIMAMTKLDYKIYEGEFKANLRKQAAKDSGYYKVRVGTEDVRIKATEKALETCFETDKEWIEKRKLL